MKFLLITLVTFLAVACTNEPVKKPALDETSKKLGRAKLPQDPKLSEYAKSLKERLNILPNKAQRGFTQGYVDYMMSGDPQAGQKLIKELKAIVKKSDSKMSSDWVSIFGSGAKLKEKKINLGVLSSTRLMKLISFGDPTSIEFLLIYTAAVELDENDSARLKNYENIIKSSYKEILKASILKNEAFLLDYPPAI